MGMFIADTDMGCALYRARDIEAARREAVREAGTFAYRSIRKAETADIEWVLGMGGQVPA